jgi:hypothetical protein
LSTLFGASNVPGEVTAFGPIDADTARRLAASAGTHPATRWCVTVVDQDGHPVGHGCSRGRHTAPPGRARSDRSPPGSAPPDRSPPVLRLHDRTLELLRQFGITVTPLAAGTCDHGNEESGYEPGITGVSKRKGGGSSSRDRGSVVHIALRFIGWMV